MVHTVGIAGAAGNVGLPTAKALVKVATAGKISLVVLHREGRRPEKLSEGKNVEFRAYNADGPADQLDAAVKDINVYISAAGFEGLASEPKMIDALARSPSLVTYIPPIYSLPYRSEDFSDPKLGPVLSFIHTGLDYAKKKNVPVTVVYNSIFDLYWFQIGFLGAPLKDNAIWANKKQLENRIPITALDHLGAALMRIATSDPEFIKSKEFSVTTFSPTGQEIVDLYTKIHGKPSQIKDWTSADRDAQRDDAANFGAAKVAYWDRWESGKWDFEADGRVEDKEYDGPGLEEVARKFLS